MNEILGSMELWSPVAREKALQRYDAKIVDAFYKDLTSIEKDRWSLRDGVIPLPDRTSGYIRAMLVGTTGTGKTTVIRQLIGTNPESERFPSTSAAKTTVADMEIVLNDGPEYRAVVTFIGRDDARNYIEECVSAAVLSSLRGRPQSEVSRRLLEHSEQRFRLSYLLGSLPAPAATAHGFTGDDFDSEDENEDRETEAEPAEVSPDERSRWAERLQEYLASIQALGVSISKEVQDTLGVSLQDTSMGNEEREEREVADDG